MGVDHEGPRSGVEHKAEQGEFIDTGSSPVMIQDLTSRQGCLGLVVIDCRGIAYRASSRSGRRGLPWWSSG